MIVKIKVTLSNPKYCEGCMFCWGKYGLKLSKDHEPSSCTLEYKTKRIQYGRTFKVLRPKECIKENGL